MRQAGGRFRIFVVMRRQTRRNVWYGEDDAFAPAWRNESRTPCATRLSNLWTGPQHQGAPLSFLSYTDMFTTHVRLESRIPLPEEAVQLNTLLKHFSSFLRCLCVPVCALLFSMPLAHAQVSGVISGTITDQSGAIVSAATVTVKNVDTGASRSTVTDADGHYQLTSLPVGQYEVQANKTGFAEEVRTGIHLVVAQAAIVNL